MSVPDDHVQASSGGSGSGGPPEVEFKKRSGPSVVWLIPMVALAVAGWLIFTTFAEKGPEITITFRTAAGLEAGKTKIKYKDLDVGVVTDIDVLPDLSGVIVNAELKKGVGEYLGEDTRFWVVRPMLTASGVTGLNTLISGSYIEFDPIKGEERRNFVGLEEPPLVRSDEEGREYILKADGLGSVGRGSGLYYRGIAVGEVMGYSLAEDQSHVEIKFFIKAPYDDLIKPSTRFWNSSGITASLDANGIQIQTESIAALIGGGITFIVPPGDEDEAPAEEGSVFKLFKNQELEQEERFKAYASYLAYFEGSIRGLARGAPVEFRGIRIGSVTDVKLELDYETFEARIPVTFDIEPDRVKGVRLSGDPYGVMAELVRRGLRAQLKQGSFITGQLYINLDMHPNEPTAELKTDDIYPQIPTIPSDLEQITRSIDTILTKIANLPLEELLGEARQTVQIINSLPIAEFVEETRGTVRAIGRLVDSPEVREALVSLDSALVGIDQIVADAGDDLEPLLKSLREASEAGKEAILQAQEMLESADRLIGERSEVRYKLVGSLSELAEAARSIRLLADYLERHPDALLKGKGE